MVKMLHDLQLFPPPYLEPSVLVAIIGDHLHKNSAKSHDRSRESLGSNMTAEDQSFRLAGDQKAIVVARGGAVEGEASQSQVGKAEDRECEVVIIFDNPSGNWRNWRIVENSWNGISKCKGQGECNKECIIVYRMRRVKTSKFRTNGKFWIFEKFPEKRSLSRTFNKLRYLTYYYQKYNGNKK